MITRHPESRSNLSNFKLSLFFRKKTANTNRWTVPIENTYSKAWYNTYEGPLWGGGVGGGGGRQKWDIIGRRGSGLASVLDVQSFFYLKKLIFRHDQICWAKHYYIIDKKSSFWLWGQTVKPSFNYIIALFVG